MRHRGSNGSGVIARVLKQLAAAGVALASWLCLWAPHAEAAAFDAEDSTWQGCSELLAIARQELGPDHVLSSHVLDWSSLTKQDSLLILHPTIDVSSEDAAAFLESGGQLGLLDDFGTGADLLRQFGIQRADLPVPMDALRHQPELPIAVPWTTLGDGALQAHPAVGQATRIALNHATGFSHEGLTPVLRVRAKSGADGTVALAASVGQGHLFAMGDPSALTNQMLRYDGNRAFAHGLVRYLGGSVPDRSKGRRLVLVANASGEVGSYGAPTAWDQPTRDARRRMGLLMTRIQEHGLPPWLTTLCGGLCVALAAVYAWTTSSRPYRRPAPSFAQQLPMSEQGGPPGRWAALVGRSPLSAARTLLALRQALLEGLQAMGAPQPDLSPAERIRTTGLTEKEQRELIALLKTMNQVESAVAQGQRPNVSQGQLRYAAQLITAALDVNAEGSAPLLSPYTKPGESPT